MNGIFTVILIISAIALCIISPNGFLTAMIDGAKGALNCAVTLFCIYAVWMGISKIAEDAGLCQKISRRFTPFIKKFFATKSTGAAKDISMNITCNLLGLGGAATPFAVSAIQKLDSENNDFAKKLLFVLNATSVQIFPATVIALRASLNSQSPADIFIPSLIATAVCTVSAVALFLLFNKIGAGIWRK
ncbi:MAG: hypothetical protein E7370_03180 [Clostridiales bacterium]|nr:hypothetical protein [Clostridiales bacterium]